MKDIALDSDFDVFLDDTNDLSTVEGQDAFEQSVAVMLTDFMYESVTGIAGNESTIKEKLRLEASRVARQHGAIDSIASIDVNQAENDPSTYNVEIEYVAGGNYEFELSE